MSKKVIVAGGGHGGIAVASILSRNGFDATVYEKNLRENMGYDWTDIFDPKALAKADILMPDKSLFEYKENMTFYSPDEKTPIRQQVPEDELEIKMERRDIYNLLIDTAEKNGVKFVYNCNIENAIIKDNRVVGINTSLGEIYGDLIIDACGCESPVRSSLPDDFGIEKHPNLNEKFYVYRAFYNKGTGNPVKDKYKVCLLPEGKLGIGWVATEEEYTDLLIGRFEPFDMEEVERTAEYFRSRNESLGADVVRGGQFVEIPVRQSLSVMVANGYAAIGDSAFMTVPIIGSGIANSLRAAPILAKAVMDDRTGTYTAETLWQYQYNFYKNLGGGLAPLAAVKLLLTRITPEQLDYIFEKGVLTWREMTITADSTSITDFVHPSLDMPKRALAIVKDIDLLKKMLKVGADIGKIITHCATLPKKYNKAKVKEWAESYDKIFK
ncbi:MAG: NAD(P)/FAD-dependent oxidoreductase [Acutalibacteraceae bacterium]|nr:NAD(P)/FAD-dependent oxidoreductase [Acutalibacteraceae bacterium]